MSSGSHKTFRPRRPTVAAHVCARCAPFSSRARRSPSEVTVGKTKAVENHLDNSGRHMRRSRERIGGEDRVTHRSAHEVSTLGLIMSPRPGFENHVSNMRPRPVARAPMQPVSSTKYSDSSRCVGGSARLRALVVSSTSFEFAFIAVLRGDLLHDVRCATCSTRRVFAPRFIQRVRGLPLDRERLEAFLSFFTTRPQRRSREVRGGRPGRGGTQAVHGRGSLRAVHGRWRGRGRVWQQRAECAALRSRSGAREPA